MNCLKAYRKRVKLTQFQFANMLGLSRSNYAMIENQFSQPTAKIILAIALITKIDLITLYNFVNRID